MSDDVVVKGYADLISDSKLRGDELATERGHHRVRDEAIEPPVDDLGLNQHLAE